ncbi:MAG TPA: ATP-binding protein [Mycobacteriales bacterium]|jgi:anti-sigma regulatory factor (Ser/Thr protein kinase)|nr:ATP-binding protein [Mycobacteriales bacterium]
MPDGHPSAVPDWLDPTHPSNVMTIGLTAAPVSVGVARSQVKAICLRYGFGELCDTATLLVSELMTNAIVHGAGEVTLSVACTDRDLSVGVSDESPSSPSVDLDPPTDRTGGRGLFLVERLSSSWSYIVYPGGKTVWFCLAATSERSSAAAGQ